MVKNDRENWYNKYIKLIAKMRMISVLHALRQRKIKNLSGYKSYEELLFLHTLLKMDEDLSVSIQQYLDSCIIKEQLVDNATRQAAFFLPKDDILHFNEMSDASVIYDSYIDNGKMIILDEKYLLNDNFDVKHQEYSLKCLQKFIIFYNEMCEEKMVLKEDNGHEIDLCSYEAKLNHLPMNIRYFTIAKCINKWRQQLKWNFCLKYREHLTWFLRYYNWQDKDRQTSRCTLDYGSTSYRMILNHEYLTDLLNEGVVKIEVLQEHYKSLVKLARLINCLGHNDKIKISEKELKMAGLTY